MKPENIRKYAEYHADNYPSLGMLKSTFWALLFFWFCGAVAALVSDRYICIGIITAYILIYRAAVSIFQRKCKTPYYVLRFFAKGILGTVLSVFFLLFVFLILEVTDRITAAYVIILTASYLTVLAVLNFATLLCIKHGVYAKKSDEKKRGKTIAVCGTAAVCALLGLIAARLAVSRLKAVDGDIVIAVFIALIFVVICLCSMGTTEFIKCYYILKYPELGSADPKRGAEDLVCTSRDKPWLLGRVLLIFIAVVFAVVLAGLLMMKFRA